MLRQEVEMTKKRKLIKTRFGQLYMSRQEKFQAAILTQEIKIQGLWYQQCVDSTLIKKNLAM